MTSSLILTQISPVVSFLYSSCLSTPIIPIAGTNGKGSGSAGLSSILAKSNLRVARFNSLRLVDCIQGKKEIEEPISPVRTEPPTDPAPSTGSRPSDVLISRLHELKRLSKSLAAYFDSLASAHTSHGKALSSLEKGETIRTKWLESSLFLPPVVKDAEGKEADGGGWAGLMAQLKEETGLEAEDHFKLAKIAQEEVSAPLKNIRVEIKSFIAELDKQVHSLAADVLKERQNSVNCLTALATSIASYESTPLALPASSDPFIVRSTAELQMRHQVAQENELLRLTVLWQAKTKKFEEEVFGKIKDGWKKWEEANVAIGSTGLERRSGLSKRIEEIPVDAEWRHFETLNHIIPADTPARNLDLLDYPNRDHAATRPVKEGVMERKKRFVKNWKEAYFVLTPSGYLHEYASSSTPFSQPHISLFLPNCTVHPLPAATPTSNGKERGAKFTIEGRKSAGAGTLHGTLKMKHKELGRSYRCRSWEEAKGWRVEIEKLSKASSQPFTASSLSERQGPAPDAVQNAGLPAVVEHEGPEQTADEEDVATGSSDEEEEEPRDRKASLVTASTSLPEETKPAYSELPDVVAGVERDVKLKTGPTEPSQDSTAALPGSSTQATTAAGGPDAAKSPVELPPATSTAPSLPPGEPIIAPATPPQPAPAPVTTAAESTLPPVKDAISPAQPVVINSDASSRPVAAQSAAVVFAEQEKKKDKGKGSHSRKSSWFSRIGKKG
ncbi:hypothetical protein JCM5296_001052 [Sporobolomyces johnsonii]